MVSSSRALQWWLALQTPVVNANNGKRYSTPGLGLLRQFLLLLANKIWVLAQTDRQELYKVVPVMSRNCWKKYR
jgi:hypothetical protein